MKPTSTVDNGYMSTSTCSVPSDVRISWMQPESFVINVKTIRLLKLYPVVKSNGLNHSAHHFIIWGTINYGLGRDDVKMSSEMRDEAFFFP